MLPCYAAAATRYAGCHAAAATPRHAIVAMPMLIRRIFVMFAANMKYARSERIVARTHGSATPRHELQLSPNLCAPRHVCRLRTRA